MRLILALLAAIAVLPASAEQLTLDRIYADPALSGPGVRNLRVSEAAAPAGLFYAPDPSSQSVCSIGGNVAENSGGVHCLKYGLTTHNLLAVRAIDLDRDSIRTAMTQGDAHPWIARPAPIQRHRRPSFDQSPSPSTTNRSP